jgi:transmembrane sensor
MNPDIRPKINMQVIEEAAEWFVEFRAGDVDAEARQRFDAWLRMSPEHVRAYLETEALWNEGAALDNARRFDTAALISLARTDDNVIFPDANPAGSAAPAARFDAPSVQATGVASQTSAVTVQPRRRARLRLAAAIAATLALVLAAALTSFVRQRGLYVTGIGEQRTISLADGSMLKLNSRSKVRVHFTRAERDVDLLEGQALFRVAKDKTRPFIVQSANASIRAVGTEFDVYRKRNGTVVTVLEGRVAVLSTLASPSGESRGNNSPDRAAAAAGPEAGSSYLVAGEQITVASVSRLLPLPLRANLAAATAWTQRQLVLDSASLADVAEEFNRYNARQLVVNDAGLGDFHISGVFSSTDPALLVRFLRGRGDIVVTETDDVIHVSRK